MSKMGLFIVVLLVSFSSCEKQPQWTAYTDMMTAICAHFKGTELRTQKRVLTSCFTGQENYLHCVSAQPVGAPITAHTRDSKDFYRHTLPCGWKEINPTLHLFRKTVFSIVVKSSFHINLTFPHFELPTSIRRGFSFGSFEYVKLTKSLHPSARGTLLSGRRAPFWVKWAHNRLFVMHRGIEGYPQVGSFILQYQVCEPERKAHTINLLTRSNIHRYANSSIIVRLRGTPFWPVSESLSYYSFHIIGSKTKALDLAIDKQHSYKGFIKAVAFEAPDPTEAYIHPDSHFLIKGDWIYFFIFQGYLQLWCAKSECQKLSLQYAWGFTIKYAETLIISQKGLGTTIQFPSAHCQGNSFPGWPDSYIYCSYVFINNDMKRLHVFLEEVWFEGFDFVGNYSSDNTCLLAGVTMMDIARYDLLVAPERYFKETGQPLEEDVVDNIFPEVTICNPFTYMENASTATHELPMTDFVTTTSRLLVIVYAYGHHIDLKNSRVSIRVSLTSSIGLLLSCPRVKKDRLLQYDVRKDRFLKYGPNTMRSDYVSLTKGNSCSEKSYMLYYAIAMETDKSFSLKILYCSIESGETNIGIVSPVGYTRLKDNPLVIQSYFDPATSHALGCHVFESDGRMRVPHSYDIETEVSHSIDCVEINSVLAVGIFDKMAPARVNILPNESTVNNQYKEHISAFRLHIYIFNVCVRLRITVSGSCEKLEKLDTKDVSISTARQSLSHVQYSSLCKNYQLPPVWNDTLELRTYRFLISQEMGVDILRSAAGTAVQIGTLSADLLNSEIPAYQLGLILTANHCPDYCKQFELSIAYEEAVTGELIWLQWDVYMGESKKMTITITQISLTDWIVYMTRIGHKLPCASEQEQCEPLIEFDTFFEQSTSENIHRPIAVQGNEHDPVAHLIFIWTQEPHTWEEAEAMCSIQGQHLVSLTTEAEYFVLLDLLLGESQQKHDRSEIAILTPCKLETPLCAIHIGMQVKEGMVSWKDHAPTGFLRWNAVQFSGPHYMRHSPDQYHRYKSWEDILSWDRRSVQPIYNGTTMCTALVGSPSPRQMEYITIPCDQKLSMAGVVCMHRKASRSERHVYGLTHITFEHQSHYSFSASNSRLFNLERFNTTILNSSYIHLFMESGASGYSSLLYYESLSESLYKARTKTFKDTFWWPWVETKTWCNRSACERAVNESAIFCPNENGNNCDCLMNICSKLGTASYPRAVRTLTKYVMIPHSHGFQNISVSLTGNELMAVKHCEEKWISLRGKCLRLVYSSNKENWIRDMFLTCNKTGKPGSNVFISPHGNDGLEEDFTKLNLGKRPVAFVNSLNTCVLYSSAVEGRYSVCQYQQQKQHEAPPLILCSKEMTRTSCPAGYILCSNQCVSELSWCDGQKDCQDAADEKACQHMCSAEFSTDLEFCLNDCHPNNCTCNALVFQCESGGCLNSGRLCDGILDCLDGSDEQFCGPIDVTNTIGNDTVVSLNAERVFSAMNNINRKHYIQSLKTSSLHSMAKCDPTVEFPCLHWNPVCYPVDKRCVYDHTSKGHLKYCRNGQHLLGCEEAQCSGTYKCTQSYCVPTHMVCDGIIDCPYRDDELSCPIQTCVNMLHCGTRCIHPNEVCDGVIHCEDGTDEQFCQPPECPSECDCLGHSVHCEGSDVGEILNLTGLVKIATIRSNQQFVLDHVIFHNVQYNLFLDLSNNSLGNIDSLSTFHGFISLIMLNVSNNRIIYLGRDTFLTLSNIRKLDLSGNPLVEIRELTFAGLTNLTFLYLHHSKLAFISARAFASVNRIQVLDASKSALETLRHICLSDTSVKILDIRGTKLKSSQIGSNECLRHVSIVLSDQKGVCCINVMKGKCHSVFGKPRECKALLGNSAYVFSLYAIIVFIVLGNAISFLFKLRVVSPDSTLVANLCLANVLMVLPLYAVTHWNTGFGTQVSFHETFLEDDKWCKTSGVMLIMSNQIGSMVKLLISVVKCYGVLSLSSHRAHSKGMCLKVTVLCVWIFWAGICVALALIKNNVPVHGVSECLLGQKNTIAIRLFLIVCASSNITCCLVCMAISALIIRAVLASAHLAVGRKHGGSLFTSVVIKLLTTSMTTILALMAPSTLLLLWSFDIELSCRTVVSTAIVVFTIQPLTNPIVYTLCTRRFRETWRQVL